MQIQPVVKEVIPVGDTGGPTISRPGLGSAMVHKERREAPNLNQRKFLSAATCSKVVQCPQKQRYES